MREVGAIAPHGMSTPPWGGSQPGAGRPHWPDRGAPRLPDGAKLFLPTLGDDRSHQAACRRHRPAYTSTARRGATTRPRACLPLCPGCLCGCWAPPLHVSRIGEWRLSSWDWLGGEGYPRALAAAVERVAAASPSVPSALGIQHMHASAAGPVDEVCSGDPDVADVQWPVLMSGVEPALIGGGRHGACGGRGRQGGAEQVRQFRTHL